MPQEYYLRNVMEILVQQQLSGLKSKLGGCTCDKCCMDISAYALNHLPVQYVVSQKGELYSKLASLSLQHETDITAKLTEGAQVVHAHPRH